MLEKIMDLQILLNGKYCIQGGTYAGTNHGPADPALSDDCSWNSWSDRDAGSTPYLQKNPAKDKSDNKPERKMAESVEDTR